LTRFIREFNESIASGNKLRFFYRFKKSDDNYIILEATGHPHFAETRQMPSNSTTPVCAGFFMMAREYPTKNAALLDSFLEHKIENERLTRRIAELKKEELEHQRLQSRNRENNAGSSMGSRTETDNSYGTQRTQSSPNLNHDSRDDTNMHMSSKSMPPPAKPNLHGAALTRQNLDNFDASPSTKADSLRDKMARFEGVSHAETIEMLTGLRYHEGERSKGISTGDTSPSLIRGDAGVPMPIDKESRSSSERKKKIKVANEYVCTDCGTLESPEWRKGPTGPKTYVSYLLV